MKRLQKLEKSAAALMPAPPWTFAEFAEKWQNMDALSQALYQTMAATPDLFPQDDCRRIRGFLERLGVTVEPQPFDVEALEGDTT